MHYELQNTIESTDSWVTDRIENNFILSQKLHKQFYLRLFYNPNGQIIQLSSLHHAMLALYFQNVFSKCKNHPWNLFNVYPVTNIAWLSYWTVQCLLYLGEEQMEAHFLERWKSINQMTSWRSLISGLRMLAFTNVWQRTPEAIVLQKDTSYLMVTINYKTAVNYSHMNAHTKTILVSA